MVITGRKEAFLKMLSERGVYKKLGVDRVTVSSWKIRIAKGQTVSDDKMKEMLLKYGATLEHDEVWKI